jgi:hypothetical protein
MPTHIYKEKSNAALWEQYDPKEIKYDLDHLCITEVEKKYNSNRKRIYIFCKKFGVDASSFKGINRNDVDIPSKEDLIESIKDGKQAAAKKYKTSIPTITRWLQKYEINIEPYAGKKAGWSVSDLRELAATFTDRQLAIKYNTTPETIRNFAIANGFTLKRYSDGWHEQKNLLENKFEWIIKENETRDILDISKEMGLCHSTVLVFLKSKNHNIISHSINKSSGELEVKEYIISLGFECYSIKRKFEERVFEVDCFIPSKNVAIEYCGEYWHSDLHKDKKYHQDKFMWCQKQGILLITIFAHEWKFKRLIIESIIKSKLGMSTKIFGRKTKVVDVSTNAARKFHETNHINGYVNSNINRGLMHNNELVMVLSISKSRFDRSSSHEIIRMSSKLNHSIIGGLSKLLKYSPFDTLMTYADLRFGDGNAYEKAGFNKLTPTPPNYWYFKKNTGTKLESRMKFQKHKLSNILPIFDHGFSEYTNMFNNGYLRIYDCGSNKFSYVRN